MTNLCISLQMIWSTSLRQYFRCCDRFAWHLKDVTFPSLHFRIFIWILVVFVTTTATITTTAHSVIAGMYNLKPKFQGFNKKIWNEIFNICSKFFLNIFTSFYLSDFKCLFVCSPLTSLYLRFAIKFLLFQLKSLLGITLQNGNQIEFSATSWIQSDKTYGNVNYIYR